MNMSLDIEMSSGEDQRDQWESFLSFPDVDKQDIDQEMALAKLEGVENPSRWLIYKRLSRQAKEISLISDEALNALDPPKAFETEGTYVIEFSVIEKLSSWLRRQPSELQELVWDYLMNAEKPAKLKKVLGYLKTSGQLKSIQAIEPIPKRRITYADMIWNSLPSTVEQLVEQLEIPSKRPAATVRQALRRFRDSGLVEFDGVFWIRVSEDSETQD